MLFIVLLAIGVPLAVAGLVLVFMNIGQPFSLNNLQPAFVLVGGFLMFVVGVVFSNMAIRIRWMKRIEHKLDEVLGEKGASHSKSDDLQ